MRKFLFPLSLLLITGCFTAACARPRMPRLDPRPALVEFDKSMGTYTKKVAVFPIERGQWNNGAELPANHFSRFMETLRKQSPNVHWVAPQDDEFPEYARFWLTGASDQSAAETARRARSDGFAALLGTELADVRAHEKKTGFWIFRKNRFTATVAVSMHILDPFTAAKMAGIVNEDKSKISASEYESITARRWAEASILQNIVSGLSVDLAKEAANEIQRLRWHAAIMRVQADRVGLAVGSRQGLSIGDHLAVFEGRPIKGYRDQEYIAPAFKVGDIQIVELQEGSAEALIRNSAGIRTGDIAVRVK